MYIILIHCEVKRTTNYTVTPTKKISIRCENEMKFKELLEFVM